MLKHLHIQNYALISALDIDFAEGFDVITGETGAGKSIIMGALSLLMGHRADNKVIAEGQQKCIVEGEFDLRLLHLEAFFEKYDLDYSDLCVLRREVAAGGKSRSFVNDTPVTLAVLQELANELIDIHSQHQNLLLRDDKFQTYVVDVVAKNDKEKNDYQNRWKEYKALEAQLSDLQRKSEEESKEADYIAFQYRQLYDAQLVAEEEKSLEQEQARLEHAEDIKNGLNESLTQLAAEDIGVLSRLQIVLNECKHISPYLQEGEGLKERLQTAVIELSDISDELGRLQEQTDFDPAEQARINQRLDLLNSLMQKHHVQSVSELIALRDNFASRINKLQSYEDNIATLQNKVMLCKKEMEDAAERLTRTRRKVLPIIEQTIANELMMLGIKHAQMNVAMKDRTSCDIDGKDDIQFLFAANKNQLPQPIANVASGGEISRIMLCVKELIANQSNLPTLIFDEIDTGISGEVAANMGGIMRRMAKQRQILVITHLPQVASMGDMHYKVYKVDTEQRTETNIRLLSQEERVREIAQMLSANQVTEAAICQAKELLNIRK